jgi:ABC-type phosphate/phosphonate transport system substrate-binding protein
MKQVKEFNIIKQFLKEMKDMKRRLIRVESMLAEEQLTPEDWKEIRKSREEIRKGRYVTLDQLKRELGIK